MRMRRTPLRRRRRRRRICSRLRRGFDARRSSSGFAEDTRAEMLAWLAFLHIDACKAFATLRKGRFSRLRAWPKRPRKRAWEAWSRIRAGAQQPEGWDAKRVSYHATDLQIPGNGVLLQMVWLLCNVRSSQSTNFQVGRAVFVDSLVNLILGPRLMSPRRDPTSARETALPATRARTAVIARQGFSTSFHDSEILATAVRLCTDAVAASIAVYDGPTFHRAQRHLLNCIRVTLMGAPRNARSINVSRSSEVRQMLST